MFEYTVFESDLECTTVTLDTTPIVGDTIEVEGYPATVTAIIGDRLAIRWD